MSTYSDILLQINTNLQTNSDITAAEHRAVETALLNYISSSFLPGDIKEIDCTDAYIAANFDETGMWKPGGEREGWAICNGYNGTRNRGGRVSVGYGTGYPSVGSSMEAPVVDGSADAVVVAHSHTVGALGDISNAKEYRFGSNTSVETSFETLTTSTTGESGIGKNMQPYIVTLFIMKL